MTMTTGMGMGAAQELELGVDFLVAVRTEALHRLHTLAALREARATRDAIDRALAAMAVSIALIAEVADDELDLDRIEWLRQAVAR